MIIQNSLMQKPIHNIRNIQYRLLNIGRLLLLSIIISIVSACVSKPNLETQELIELNNNLASLQEWSISGKIAWITPKERKSAYMNWQQNFEQTRFNLSNLLGVNMASLDYDGRLATLEADGQTIQDSSPSMVIYRATRWQVPIELLKTWIKGASSESGRINTSNQAQLKQDIIRYENGLIRQINPTCKQCNQWSITYDTYNSVTLNNKNYQLPKQITMYNANQQATIKIRISKWSQ